MLEFQDGSKHREVAGSLRYDADAVLFQAYGNKKHNRTIRYADITRAQFVSGEAPDGVATVLMPLAASATGHRKYLTIHTNDGTYTLLQLAPSTHMVALIELERRAKITIQR